VLEAEDDDVGTFTTELALLLDVGDGVDEEETDGLRRETNESALVFLSILIITI
jgi:hypothetical protein